MSSAIDLPTYDKYDGPDTTSSKLIQASVAQEEKYNKLLTSLEAASGDKEKAKAAFLANSEDDFVVKLREGIEAAKRRLEEYAEEHVVVNTVSEAQRNAMTTELRSLRNDINAKRNAALEVSKTIGIDEEGVKKAVEEMPSLRHIPTGQSGASGPRVSVTVTVTGGQFTTPQVFDGLSKTAQTLLGTTKSLQDAYAQAAGVPFDKIAKVDKPLAFEYTPREGGSTYSISTQPKARKNANKPE